MERKCWRVQGRKNRICLWVSTLGSGCSQGIGGEQRRERKGPGRKPWGPAALLVSRGQGFRAGPGVKGLEGRERGCGSYSGMRSTEPRGRNAELKAEGKGCVDFTEKSPAKSPLNPFYWRKQTGHRVGRSRKKNLNNFSN